VREPAARAQVWDAGARPGSITLNIDATLLTAHSEKERAAGNYKHGYGFHPRGCWLDETGEALAAIRRPGNAGSNTAEDHFTMLGLALTQLPAENLDAQFSDLRPARLPLHVLSHRPERREHRRAGVASPRARRGQHPRLDRDWPWSQALVAAFAKLREIPAIC
jgi:Transposase DDE domain group 1